MAGQVDDEAGKRAAKTADKAHTRDSLEALSKLGEVVDGRYRSQRPGITQEQVVTRMGVSVGDSCSAQTGTASGSPGLPE